MAVLSRPICLGGRAVALSDSGFFLTDIAMALSAKTETLSKRSALLLDRFMEVTVRASPIQTWPEEAFSFIM